MQDPRHVSEPVLPAPAPQGAAAKKTRNLEKIAQADRLKAALKANMARRKAQARARAGSETKNAEPAVAGPSEDRADLAPNSTNMDE